MIKKHILMAASLGLVIPLSASTLFVSKTMNNQENILVKKEISNGENGVVKYNLCDDKVVSSGDYQRCESSIGYMNFSKSVMIELHHKEMTGFKKLLDRDYAIIEEVSIVGGMVIPGDAGSSSRGLDGSVIRVYVK